MAKCKRCHRELKSHHESEMGKVCRMKANKSADNAARKIRVEPLFIRRSPRRSYLVFTSPRTRVVVRETADGRFADCDCGANCLCQHVQLVAQTDRARFPQELAV